MGWLLQDWRFGIGGENHDVAIIMPSLRDWATTGSIKTNLIASIPKECRRHDIIIAKETLKQLESRRDDIIIATL
jgi:hypothetical protein